MSDLQIITTSGGDTVLNGQVITTKLNSRERPLSGQYPFTRSSIKGITMKLISREELKERLDRREEFELVFALGEWQYHAMHIPGSLNICEPKEALKALDPDDEIVVYCSNEFCNASVFIYYFLVALGFTNVRRYAGGLVDWESAGYPLEGEMVAA